MRIVVRFTPEGATTTEQYDETIRRLDETGDFTPEGLEYHVCYLSGDGNVRVGEVWDSREQFGAFGERLMPVLADVGIDPGEPEILANALLRIKRRAARVLWLNPLLGNPSYEPLTRGMAAALPLVDHFAAAHNLAALRDLANHLTL